MLIFLFDGADGESGPSSTGSHVPLRSGALATQVRCSRPASVSVQVPPGRVLGVGVRAADSTAFPYPSHRVGVSCCLWVPYVLWAPQPQRICFRCSFSQAWGCSLKGKFLALCSFLRMLTSPHKVCVGVCTNNAKAAARDKTVFTQF